MVFYCWVWLLRLSIHVNTFKILEFILLLHLFEVRLHSLLIVLVLSHYSWNVSYESLFGTDKRFPQPIPLSVSITSRNSFWYQFFAFLVKGRVNFCPNWLFFIGHGRLSCWYLGARGFVRLTMLIRTEHWFSSRLCEFSGCFNLWKQLCIAFRIQGLAEDASV